MPLLLYFPLIFGQSMIATRDGMGYAIFGEMFKNFILNGELPLWNRFQGLGNPFLADVQSKVFYIPFWIYVFFPNRVATLLLFLLHISFAGIGMYKLLMYNRVCNNISFYGGFIWMFSNALIFRFNHINIMLALTWIPLLVLITQKLCDTQKNIYAVFLGGSLAMQFFAGFAQTALYSDMLVFLFFVIYSISKKNSVKKIITQGILFISVYIGISAIQIIPLAEVMMFSGRNEITYDYFASYAIYPFQILQLFFPLISGGWASHINAIEFPTDLYIGILPMILIIYAMMYLRKKKGIQIGLTFACLTFILACSPRIGLGKIIYHVPLLGSFRVQGRFIPFFVFSLLIISSFTLGHIIKSSDYIGLFKACEVTLLVVVGIMFCCVSLTQTKIINEEFKSYYRSFSTYRNTLVMCVIYFCICLWLKKRIQNEKNNILNVLIKVLIVLQLFDTYFFNYDKSVDVYRVPELVKLPSIDSYLGEDVVKYIKEDPLMEQYRVYSKNEEPAGLRQALSGYNEISIIKSYTTFDNPNYIKFLNRNDLGNISDGDVYTEVNPTILSLLGVKYIVSENGEGSKLTVNQIREIGNTIYTSSDAINLEEGSVLPIFCDFKNNTWYKVTLDFEADCGLNNVFFDFYGGDGVYDSNEFACNRNQVEKKNGQAIIYVETDFDIPDDTVLRIMNFSQDDLCIKRIDIEECVSQVNDSYYRPVYQDDKYIVYQNSEACPIVFSPRNVVEMENVADYIYNNRILIDFTKSAYVEGIDDENFECADTKIEEIKVHNNSVVAQVSCDGESFIIMNQNYYPGWRVYIDGEESCMELVDSFLCGVKIPQGRHEVKFCFKSSSIKLGAFISGIVCIIVFVGVFLYSKKNHSNMLWKLEK